MEKSKNSISTFIDYKPAIFRQSKDWIIVYYCKNPISQKLDRFRIRVPSNPCKTTRRKNAIQICTTINQKLKKGWTPFSDLKFNNAYMTFAESTKMFLEQVDQELSKGDKRADTLRAYRSHISLLYSFQEKKNCKLDFAFELNQQFVVNYLDWVYYERSNSARTYNNHLFFIRTFANYLIARGILTNNPVSGIARKQITGKKREILTADLKTALGEYLPNFNYGFYTLCMATYYCMIRRTEATKLKVQHVILDRDYIFIPGTISKNKKDEHVTIPKDFKPILQQYLAEMQNHLDNDCFLFGKNFLPAVQSIPPKKISDTWDDVREKLGFESKYQFYSLKDTGITNLLEAGIAAIKVRDQARHYDIKITEGYTPRNRACDEVMRDSGISF